MVNKRKYNVNSRWNKNYGQMYDYFTARSNSIGTYFWKRYRNCREEIE